MNEDERIAERFFRRLESKPIESWNYYDSLYCWIALKSFRNAAKRSAAQIDQLPAVTQEAG